MHHAAMTIALRNFDSLGSAHPRVDTIAKGMHVAEGTARKALQDLERHGWMHVEPRDGRTNVYQALLPASSVPAILELVERRRKVRLRTSTLAVAHKLAVGLLASLGAPVENNAGLPRIRGQISQILATALDVETEAGYIYRYVMSEMPRVVQDPVKICHTKLSEYTKLYTSGRKRPSAEIDPEQAAFIQRLLAETAATLSKSDRPGLQPPQAR